jgi:hypothetical protein
MKRALILLASALVLAPICITGGYRLGEGRERRITNSMIEGSFVNNLTALESLRAGNTATAIRELETHVFMSATLLLNQPNAKHAALDIFRPNLLTICMRGRTGG